MKHSDNNSQPALDLILEPYDPGRILSLCGAADDNLRQIERRLGVTIAYSGENFHIRGPHRASGDAARILKRLYIETAPLKGSREVRYITPELIHLAITENATFENGAGESDGQPDPAAGLDGLYARASHYRLRRGPIRARTPNQADYITNINAHDICFGVGPAGTGKTFLAVAAAVEALEQTRVRRIILTRPAVEAGEKLGFLPGDLSQKVDPYLRPLYDALFEMLGFERVEKLIERQVIEIAPLAYMRGRTLNDSFIILDEAQNTTVEQMKMFLTRIGFNSRAVITGDPSQIDLPPRVRSGLKHALEVLEGVAGLGFTYFTASDVVRHPVVAAIVTAYAKWESDHPSRNEGRRERESAPEEAENA